MASYLWDDTPTWVDWVAKALGAAVGLSVAASVLSHRVPAFHVAHPHPHAIHVTASGNGCFFIAGTANGVSVTWMLDTGASFISFPDSMAESLGFHDLRYTDGNLSTANGLIPFAKVKIARITVADITLTDVDAIISKGKMSQPLLGAAFMRRLSGGFEVKHGVFTLNP